MREGEYRYSALEVRMFELIQALLANPKCQAREAGKRKGNKKAKTKRAKE